MEKLVEMGLVKSIGISNFTTKKVAELLEFAKIKPVCNQGRKSFFFIFWRSILCTDLSVLLHIFLLMVHRIKTFDTLLFMPY